MHDLSSFCERIKHTVLGDPPRVGVCHSNARCIPPTTTIEHDASVSSRILVFSVISLQFFHGSARSTEVFNGFFEKRTTFQPFARRRIVNERREQARRTEVFTEFDFST